MTVGKICIREVDTADPGESVQDAAHRMHSRNVGTLVVCNEQNQPVGMLTDRDLAVRVVAKALPSTETLVEAVMTRGPSCVREGAPIETALAHMRAVPCRRLPVVDDEQGKLIGLVSLDDILELLSEEFADIGRLMRVEGPSALASR